MYRGTTFAKKKKKSEGTSAFPLGHGVVSSPHGNWQGLSVPLDARGVERDNTNALLLSLHVPCYPCANMRAPLAPYQEQKISNHSAEKEKGKRNIFSLGYRKKKYEKATLFLSLFLHLSFPIFFFVR